MKKILLHTFLLLFVVLISKGQTIDVIYQSSDTVSGENFEDIDVKVHFKNIGTSTNRYLAEKVDLDLESGHESYFCWGPSCYPSFVFVSPDTIELTPNQLDSTFIGYLMPYATGIGVDGISTVKFKIFNANDTADKFEKIVVFIVGTVSSLSHSQINGSDVFVYPNPASTHLKLVFGELEGKSANLVIRNVLGSKVLSQNVDLKGNFANVDINELNNGIYLYSLVIDGSTIVTKKFTVRK